MPRRRGRQSFGPISPLPFRVLSTPCSRPTNIRAREPSSRLSVRGFVRFLFSFFSLIIQRAPRLARVAFLRAVARAPSRNPCAFSFGNVASSHTHTHSLSLSEPRHTPSNSPVERPLRDHLPYSSPNSYQTSAQNLTIAESAFFPHIPDSSAGHSKLRLPQRG